MDANGIRVHVAEAGPSDSAKPPILLLHGWPQHWYMWRRVIAGLRSGHRLLAPDLRGFGWTEAPGARIRRRDVRRRPGGAARRARDRARLRHRPRLGRLDRDAPRHAPSRSGWSGCSSATRRTHGPRAAPSLAAEAWRSWYTWVIATPGSRAPLARARLDRPQHPHPGQCRHAVLGLRDRALRR